MMPRRRRTARAIAVVLVVTFLGWWVTLTPSNDRRWPVEQSRLAGASVEDGRARIEGVRHFTYRSATDLDARWEDRTISLDRVRGLDVLVSDWGLSDLAHTIVSWDVEGERPLAISIESRRESGEPFDPVRGLLRPYELYYAVADEQDLVTLRAAHRHERVRLYRTTTSAEIARRLLVSYLAQVERLRTQPEFYDSLRHNCSTSTRAHLAEIGVEDTWDWRVVLNGHVDELLYARGVLDTSMDFAALRARSDVTERAQALEHEADFSARLREGLPVPAAAPPSP